VSGVNSQVGQGDENAVQAPIQDSSVGGGSGN
jgi:hypothetical protein